MKKNLFLAFVVALSFAAGWQFNTSEKQSLHANREMHDAEPEPKALEPLYWVAPMDNNYRRDEPGLSPMGMALVPVYEENEPGSVQISTEFQANFGIKTTQAVSGRLELQVDALGYVSYPEDKMNHVHSRTEGWIEKVHVFAVGDEVKAGQPLFEMYAPDVVAAQYELISNLVRGNQQIIHAAERRLALMGLDTETIERVKQSREVVDSIEFLAPSDGVVTSLIAREGMYVTPDVELMTITDLSEVWVLAELIESELSWVEEGQAVTLSFAGMPRRQWTGEIDYIYPVVDESQRTAQARVVLDNSEGLLKINMFAEMTIAAGVSKSGIIIPEQALIKGARRDRVVVRYGESLFKSIPVRAGLAANGEVIVLRGLREGDEVVVSGQFLIDSESNLEAASMRMNGQ